MARLTEEQEDRLPELHAQGLSNRAIGRALGASHQDVSTALRRLGLQANGAYYAGLRTANARRGEENARERGELAALLLADGKPFGRPHGRPSRSPRCSLTVSWPSTRWSRRRRTA